MDELTETCTPKSPLLMQVQQKKPNYCYFRILKNEVENSAEGMCKQEVSISSAY